MIVRFIVSLFPSEKEQTEVRFITMIFSVFAAVVAAGCASNPNASLGTQCEKGLSVAYQELDLAKAKGLEGTVD